MTKPNNKTTVGMLVEKLTELSMKHPQAQVYCQTGDFGPCVDYNIVNCAEDDELEDYAINICHHRYGNYKPLDTNQLVVELLKFPLTTYMITVSDGFPAYFNIIESAEDFAKRWSHLEGTKRTAKDIYKAFPDITFPAALIDVE